MELKLAKWATYPNNKPYENCRKFHQHMKKFAYKCANAIISIQMTCSAEFFHHGLCRRIKNELYLCQLLHIRCVRQKLMKQQDLQKMSCSKLTRKQWIDTTHLNKTSNILTMSICKFVQNMICHCNFLSNIFFLIQLFENFSRHCLQWHQLYLFLEYLTKVCVKKVTGMKFFRIVFHKWFNFWENFSSLSTLTSIISFSGKRH